MNKEAVQKNYAGLVHSYEKRWERFLQAQYGWALRHLEDLPQGAAVLDLGCSTGACLAALSRMRPDLKLHGVDVTPGMLAIARRRLPGAVLTEGDIESLRPHSDYDAVLSLSLLHHLRGQREHLQMLADFCKPGGRVILSDFALDSKWMRLAEIWWRRRLDSHVAAHSSAELQAMLYSVSGLDIRACELLKPTSFWRLQIYRLERV